MTPGFITGWKSIAAHIGVGTERTARNWMRKYGLPVYYMPNGRPALDPLEYEAWLKQLKFSKANKVPGTRQRKS